MKLLLGNNQSDRFVAFYKSLQQEADFEFDYIGYEALLFRFDNTDNTPVMAWNTKHERQITSYDAVYINNYYHTYELAATTAIVVQKLGIAYANHEFAQPPSMSKLTEYARLAAAGITIPKTIAGSKTALLTPFARDLLNTFPCVLKRADADRGIDNFMVASYEMMVELLAAHPARSLWVLQEFISNDGYYRIAYNGGVAQYAVFRALQERPDGNQLKKHMYRPKNGTNAKLLALEQVPLSVRELSDRAVQAMERQFAGVDCFYNQETGLAHIIEVNYNPQLVTIERYADVRRQAFLQGLKRL